MPTEANRYFFCENYPDRSEAVHWDLSSDELGPDYLRNVLRVMERQLGNEGLTTCVTWKLDELPAYGGDVVAIVMGDELSQIPAYADRVRVTFKCYGAQPQLADRPLQHPSYLNGLSALKHVRARVHHLPGRLRYAGQQVRHRWRGEPMPPIYDLPLGYGNQLDLPVRPLQERTSDLFFAGSVKQGFEAPWWSPRRWIRSPKDVSRTHMLEVLGELKKQEPTLQMHVHTNARFVLNALEWGLTEPGEVLDASAYSEALMNAKICLVPRGTSSETFRFFEGLRAGCVLITERLPSRWFYDGSPALQVDEWRELHDLVPALLADSERLQQLHEASLRWWREVCSEEAVGQFMAERVYAQGPDGKSELKREKEEIFEHPTTP